MARACEELHEIGVHGGGAPSASCVHFDPFPSDLDRQPSITEDTKLLMNY